LDGHTNSGDEDGHEEVAHSKKVMSMKKLQPKQGDYKGKGHQVIDLSCEIMCMLIAVQDGFPTHREHGELCCESWEGTLEHLELDAQDFPYDMKHHSIISS
jgi:hypothetical protein